MMANRKLLQGNASSNWTIQPPTSLTPTIPPLTTMAVICCVIFGLGITANGLVIYVTGIKMKKTANSVRFLNLALANFFYSFSIIFRIIHFSLSTQWPLGDFMCMFIPLFRSTCLFASIFLLTVVNFDRCLSVWVVVWARNKRSPNKARIVCVFVWLMSLVFSIPFVKSRSVTNDTCISGGDELSNKQLAMGRFVIGFLIPFLIITCCYVAMGIRANEIKREKKIRPFLIILTVTLSFFIFWLPIHIISIIFPNQIYISSMNQKIYTSDEYDLERKMSLVSCILAFLNSCLNSFLYMCMCLNRH